MSEPTNKTELKKQSKAIFRKAFSTYGIQMRSARCLLAIVDLPGRKTPIRKPAEDGTAYRAAGYGNLANPKKDEGISTRLIGLSTMKHRRTLVGVLDNFEEKGLIVSVTGNGPGSGKLWVPTAKGKKAAALLRKGFTDGGIAYDGLDIRGFDAEGKDRLGVDARGFKDGEYVGISHLFTIYYGSAESSTE